MKTRYIFTLKEIFQSNHLSGDNPFLMNKELPYIVKSVYGLDSASTTILERFFSTMPYIDYVNGQYVLVDHGVELMNVLLPKYWQCACITTPDNPVTNEDKQAFFNQFLSFMSANWDYYDNLLNYYDAEKSHLLQQLQTKTNISGTRGSTQSGTSGTTGTDNLTLDTTDTTNMEHLHTGTVENVHSYDSKVETDYTDETTSTSEGRLRDTPQTAIDIDADGYDSNTSLTDVTGSVTHDGEDKKSGHDTDTTTYNEDTDDTGTLKRTGTESRTLSNSSTTSNTTSDTITDEHITLDDRDTLMNRINEIQEKYMSIIKEFASKFKVLFWSMSNYEEEE